MTYQWDDKLVSPVDSGRSTAYQHRNAKGESVADEGDDSVQRTRDAERLKALEDRLAQTRRDDRLVPPGMDKFAHANQAWRMVVELVAGIALGFGVGLGLDRLLGTMPIMLVIFVFLGFAAGVKTMLRTAAEMGNAAARDRPAEPANEKPANDPAKDERD